MNKIRFNGNSLNRATEFEKLYAWAFSDLKRSMLFKYRGSLQSYEVEDAISRVMVKIAKFDWTDRTASSMQHYTFKAVLNACNDAFKVSRERLFYVVVEEVDPEEGGKHEVQLGEPCEAMTAMEHADYWATVDAFLRYALSASLYEVFYLLYLESMSLREAAQVLGKNEEAVKKARNRALSILKSRDDLRGYLKAS